jgi:hypothetical protein
MPFYPLFNINENLGFVQLANFAPNNWENTENGNKKIISFNSDGEKWIVKQLGMIPENQFKTIQSIDFSSLVMQEHEGVYIEELILLEMRTDVLPNQLNELPDPCLASTHWPEWRATIGFQSTNSRVSYQGEIIPTPTKASLLTFHPFIQFDDIRNYFVFINIEKSPVHRWSQIDIYLSGSKKKIGTRKIRNNATNIIPLDGYGLTPQDLPVFYCKNMAGIPFGFGKSISSGMLSLEHTHPPGSFTFYGNRMLAQREIKAGWVKHLQIQ